MGNTTRDKNQGSLYLTMNLDLLWLKHATSNDVPNVVGFSVRVNDYDSDDD